MQRPVLVSGRVCAAPEYVYQSMTTLVVRACMWLLPQLWASFGCGPSAPDLPGVTDAYEHCAVPKD